MKTSKLWVAGAIALAACVFSACGESGNGGSSSNLLTDGPLGELPAVAGKYLPEINELQEQRWHTSSEENREKIAKKEDALKAEWDAASKALPSLEGREIPFEAAEGVPVRPETNLKITNVTIGDDHVTIVARTTAVLTENVKFSDVSKYVLVALDRKGKPITLDGHGQAWGGKDQDIDWKAEIYREGAVGKVQFNTNKKDIHENAEGWANLAKVVIMDKESEAYKQIVAEAETE